MFENGMEVTRAERQIDDVGNCRMRTEEHSLRSQVGIGSESHWLLGQLRRIFEISDSDSDAGLKVEKSGGEASGEGQCGDAMAG